MHIHIYIYIYTYINTYTYVYIHYTYMYIHIHTYTVNVGWNSQMREWAPIFLQMTVVSLLRNTGIGDTSGPAYPCAISYMVPLLIAPYWGLLPAVYTFSNSVYCLPLNRGLRTCSTKKFLNSVVHGPEKEDQALTPISRLRKVLMHDASWNVEPDSFFPHGFHFSVADSVRPELWICCPLQHPVSVCISTVRCWSGVMCKHL